MSAQTISGVGAEISPRIGISPQAQAAGVVNGTGTDRRGYNSCKLVAKSGAVTGAPTSFTEDVKLQHSDTLGGTYTDYTPAVPNPGGSGAVGQITTINTIRDRAIDLKQAKAFVRAVSTAAFVAGTSPTLFVDVTIVLGGADVLPVADQ